MKRALVLSGGASKGAFTAGVVHYLIRDRGIKFDLAVGTSTGSLVAGPSLLGDYDYLGNVYTSVQNSLIYKNALLYWLLNKVVKLGPVDASMKPLRELITRYYLADEKMKALAAANKEMVVSIVDVFEAETVFVSSRDLDAEKANEARTFVEAVIASCSEPVFTEPVQVFSEMADSPRKDHLFYDGGVREFAPFEKAVELKAEEIWAVCTHPLGFRQTEWGRTTAPEDASIFKVILWLIGTLLNEVERGDFFRAYVYSQLGWAKDRIAEISEQHSLDQQAVDELLGVFDGILAKKQVLPRLYVITPQEPMPTSLEFDPAIMANYFADGQLAAERFVAAGQPEFSSAGGWLVPRLGEKIGADT